MQKGQKERYKEIGEDILKEENKEGKKMKEGRYQEGSKVKKCSRTVKKKMKTGRIAERIEGNKSEKKRGYKEGRMEGKL